LIAIFCSPLTASSFLQIMVKTFMSTMTMAIVAADELTSLLQLSARVRQSQGQRILAALAEEDSDTICVEAAAGDVAPVAGSFTSGHDSSSVEVAAGSVAGEAGSFCVAKQDVLLIQRTFGLNTARDFEAALGSKRSKRAATTTTTTAMDWNIFNFSKNPNKVVVVERDACPKVEAGLVQTMDASVQQKSAKKKKLDADQLRVCECRNFMKSSVEPAFQVPAIKDMFTDALNEVIMSNRPDVIRSDLMDAINARNPSDAALLQRSFDTALATKNKKKKKTTTTTTTPCAASAIVKACTGASYMDDWASVAKLLNNPEVTSLAKAANITGGWAHCDQSWVVQGACGVFVETIEEETARYMEQAKKNIFR
jgi:hypothetical protein